jgi:hypothetical protein
MRLLDSYRDGSYKTGGVALRNRVVANGELERPVLTKGE